MKHEDVVMAGYDIQRRHLLDVVAVDDKWRHLRLGRRYNLSEAFLV